ncbi:hypothetical protein HPP92_004205 [Vanilla planifolia]|uniref:Uncharacterized protein n=1 Tax=Vanilla planifolia TaxID=51239 RepID=A0A835S1C7_VANPL|nr:hypothetical protein HPP92_004205 [Vanilla planifolia]
MAMEICIQIHMGIVFFTPWRQIQHDKENVVEAKLRDIERDNLCAPSTKATSVDATFPPAWIGSGNAYAVQEETDQAMLAYRTAARLFPGCHLPTLYIGMEYMRTHNFKLAEQARAICPSDPLVYNELGVVAYHMKEYQKAAQWFEMTLVNVSSSMSEIWEPTVVNLAHAQRKLKMYQKAISSYEKALALSTRSLSAYAGLAYTYHLMDNLDSAVKFYHKTSFIIFGCKAGSMFEARRPVLYRDAYDGTGGTRA